MFAYLGHRAVRVVMRIDPAAIAILLVDDLLQVVLVLHVFATFVARHISRDQELLVFRQVALHFALVAHRPFPRRAMMNEKVASGHELRRRNHAGLAKLRLSENGRDGFTDAQRRALERVNHVFHLKKREERV